MAGAVLAVLLLWLLLWAAVPPIARHYVQKIGSEMLGRTVTVDRIEFKPWTLEARIESLKVAKADGSGPQFAIGSIDANLELESIIRLGPVIEELRVEAPQVLLTHLEDGHYDIDDILQRLAARPSQPKAESSEPARFAVYNISISKGMVRFDDRTVGKVQAVDDLSLDVPFISSLKSKREIKVQPRLAFVLNGTPFSSSAESTPFIASRKTDLQLKFADLDLAPFAGYVPAGLPLVLREGKLDLDLTANFEQSDRPALRLGGQVVAHGLKLDDTQKQPALQVDQLAVTLADVRPFERVVHLGEVAIRSPHLVLKRDAQGRINLVPTTATAGRPAAASAAAAPPAAPASAAAAPGAGDGASAPMASAASAAASTPAAPSTSSEAAPATPAAAAAPPPSGSRADPLPWTFELDRFRLEAASVQFSDATTQPTTELKLDGFGLEAQAIGWPSKEPARFKGQGSLAGAPVSVEGTGDVRQAGVNVQISKLPLGIAGPYLKPYLEPGVSGSLDAQVRIDWRPEALRLSMPSVRIDQLGLDQDQQTLVRVGQLSLADSTIDLQKRSLALGTLTVSAPKLKVARDADRRWMFERWLRTPPATSSSTAPTEGPGAGAATASATSPASSPWRVELARFVVQQGQVAFADASVQPPVSFDLGELAIDAQRLSPGNTSPSPVKLSARLDAGRGKPGRLDYDGSVTLAPLAAEGRLDVAGIPVHAFKSYYGEPLGVDLRRALASFKGNLKFQNASEGPTVNVTGDTTVEDLRANASGAARGATPASAAASSGRGGEAARSAPADAPSASAASAASPAATSTVAATDPASRAAASTTRGAPLLQWKSLHLRAMKVALRPGQPLALSVGDTTVTDLFARVVINPDGRLNLLELTGSSAPPTDPSDGKAATSRRSPGGRTTTTQGRPVAGGRTVPAEERVGAEGVDNSAPTAPAARKREGPQPAIDFGPIKMVNGRIDFTDLFIKPNYSADLTELNGSLSGFASGGQGGKGELADLQLQGKAQQTANLEIAGKVAPLADPLRLDITARMRDLDLPPLSPYSVRYAGHGIERGKLSMDVRYEIDAQGQLTATNKLILNQLQFGNAVDGAPNSLPVRLAVALLADRNGVIDIDFPIRGSLNDPQFSLGPLIVKAIGNLVMKAVTAPFALLTGGLSGSSENSTIAFPAGSAELDGSAKANLDKIAAALKQKDQLRLTIAGTADLKREAEAWKRQHLRDLALSEKRRAAARANQDASKVGAVGDAEYPKLIESVYDRTELPDKPKNLIGMTKDIPLADMEARLMAQMQVGPQQMQQLAVARAGAARDYLLAQKLPSDRIFLGAAKPEASGNDWIPGVRLDLSAR